MDDILDHFRRMVIVNPSFKPAPPSASGDQTTANANANNARRTEAQTRAARSKALKIEPTIMYPIEVNGVPGLSIAQWAVKENMEDLWYTYIRDFDLGWKNIEHCLPADGRPVCLFNVRSPRTNGSPYELDYAHNLILSPSGRPLMLGHLICQFVRAQWRSHETAIDYVLRVHAGRPSRIRTREQAQAWAQLVPLDELYIVAVLRASVRGIEGWFPKIERRPKVDAEGYGQQANA